MQHLDGDGYRLDAQKQQLHFKVRELWALLLVICSCCSVFLGCHSKIKTKQLLQDCYKFLMTLTQDIRIWKQLDLSRSLAHCEWTLEEPKATEMDRRKTLLLHRWSCASLQPWTLCLLWIRWTEWSGSTWETSPIVSPCSCLVVLLPLGSLPVSR